MQGPMFETQGQQQGGRVVSWIQRMLTAPPSTSTPTTSASVGPDKSVLAQTALLHLLSTNVDLFSICVDQCYAAHPAVSRAYFQVLHTSLHVSMKACLLHLLASCMDTTKC